MAQVLPFPGCMGFSTVKCMIECFELVRVVPVLIFSFTNSTQYIHTDDDHLLKIS